MSWRSSWEYDLLEVFGEHGRDLGYAYAYLTRQHHVMQMCQTILPPGARLLDVAAAQGNFSILLAESGYEVTWNDIRSELAGYVRSKVERGMIDYVAGNMLDLDCRDYDGVVMTEVIEHVAHPDSFLAKAASFLKPGGYLLGSTPNGAYVRNKLPRFSDCPDPSAFERVQFKPDADGHIFLLHADELERLARLAGLEVIEIRYFTNPLTNGHCKTRRLLPWLPRPLIDTLEALSERLPMALRRRLHVGMAFTLRRHSTS